MRAEEESSYAVVTVVFENETWTFTKAKVQIQCSERLQLDLTHLASEMGTTAARHSLTTYSMAADFLPDEDGVVYYFKSEGKDVT